MTTRYSVRRSPFLVTYWEGDTHCVYNYLTREQHECSFDALAILAAASNWTSREELQAGADGDRERAGQMIDQLVSRGLLERTGSPTPESGIALGRWSSWNPVAGFFHAASQPPVLAPSDGRRQTSWLRERGFPAALKTYSETALELPAFAEAGGMAEILQARRTWREFGERKLTLQELATLLGWTFGVQRWLEIAPEQWAALKTSPSGGARHSIEAYVLAFAVEELDVDTYHYCPDRHALTPLRSATTRQLLQTFLPTQPGFQDPAALIIMTAVFERVQWKYPHPHAYRVVLLDAGHLSQTFALVATGLSLAPFCTAALDVCSIERHLAIDGIGESVILALGVGARPSGKAWAPLHDRGDPLPRTTPPAWQSRFAGAS